MHGTIVLHRMECHNGRLIGYNLPSLNAQKQEQRDIWKPPPLPAEDYLRNEMSKDNQLKADNNFNKPIDHFVQLNKHKHSNEIGVKRKDMKANIYTIQPPRHMNKEHNERIRQKGI